MLFYEAGLLNSVKGVDYHRLSLLEMADIIKCRVKNKMFFMEKEIEMTTFIIDIIENEKVNIINRS